MKRNYIKMSHKKLCKNVSHRANCETMARYPMYNNVLKNKNKSLQVGDCENVQTMLLTRAEFDGQKERHFYCSHL